MPTRKKACFDCRERKVKCEQPPGFAPCKNCMVRGLVCSGPIPTAARMKKEKKKTSRNDGIQCCIPGASPKALIPFAVDRQVQEPDQPPASSLNPIWYMGIPPQAQTSITHNHHFVDASSSVPQGSMEAALTPDFQLFSYNPIISPDYFPARTQPYDASVNYTFPPFAPGLFPH